LSGCDGERWPGGKAFRASWYRCSASPSCLAVFWHCARAAAARTFCTPDINRPIRIEMIAMTTSNSMSVKPRLRLRWSIADSLGGHRDPTDGESDRADAVVFNMQGDPHLKPTG